MSTLTRSAAPLLAAAPLILAGIFAGVFAGSPASAQSQSAARAHVERVADGVLRLLNAPGSLQAKEADFRGILVDTTDMRGIAGFAAGRYGRAMSAAQRDAYVELFIDYTVRAYTRQFEEYMASAGGYNQNGAVQVLRVMDAGRRGTYVKTRIASGAGEPLSVEWLVRERRGRTLISDMIVEGVSLAQLTRDEFIEMLNRRRGNIPAFLDDLRSAIQAL